MKTTIKGKEVVLCDFCEARGTIRDAHIKCLLCEKDICGDDDKSRGSSWSDDTWKIGNKDFGVCPDCVKLLNAHKYENKPKNWESKKSYFKEAFEDIFSRKNEKALGVVVKEMQQMLKNVFSEVEEAQKDKLFIAERKAKLEAEIKELEKKKNNLNYC